MEWAEEVQKVYAQRRQTGDGLEPGREGDTVEELERRHPEIPARHQ